MSSRDRADLAAFTSHQHEIEVTLLDGPDGVALASCHLERDPTRRESKVRASKGPATGRRVRLRLPLSLIHISEPTRPY